MPATCPGGASSASSDRYEQHTCLSPAFDGQQRPTHQRHRPAQIRCRTADVRCWQWTSTAPAGSIDQSRCLTSAAPGQPPEPSHHERPTKRLTRTVWQRAARQAIDHLIGRAGGTAEAVASVRAAGAAAGLTLDGVGLGWLHRGQAHQRGSDGRCERPTAEGQKVGVRPHAASGVDHDHAAVRQCERAGVSGVGRNHF